MSTEAPGRKALEALDEVLAQEPHKDGHGLTAVTLCLGRFREELLSRQKDEAPSPKERERLARLNTIISVVLAAHFPLGSPPWDQVKAARGWLSALVSAVE